MNPELHAEAKLIDLVDGVEIPSFVWKPPAFGLTGMGTGGMLTKVRAADVALGWELG